MRSRFVSGDQATFTCDLICIDPIGVCHTAELMTFKDGFSGGIELFFDATPFEKRMAEQRPMPQSA